MIPQIGRTLRLVFGVLFLAITLPYYRSASWISIATTVGVVLGLVALYLLLHLFVRNDTPGLNPYLGALLARIPDSLIFVLGGIHGQSA
jgi:hypothetical protein